MMIRYMLVAATITFTLSASNAALADAGGAGPSEAGPDGNYEQIPCEPWDGEGDGATFDAASVVEASTACYDVREDDYSGYDASVDGRAAGGSGGSANGDAGESTGSYSASTGGTSSSADTGTGVMSADSGASVMATDQGDEGTSCSLSSKRGSSSPWTLLALLGLAWGRRGSRRISQRRQGRSITLPSAL